MGSPPHLGRAPLSLSVRVPHALSVRRQGAASELNQGDTMFTSLLAKLRTARQRRGGRRSAHRGMTRVVYAAAVAGITLTAAGLAGGAAPALAATQSLGPPSYSPVDAGYNAQGRSFRFVSTTLTVAPRIMPKDSDGSAIIAIHATCHGPVPAPCAPPSAYIYVAPGGGPGTVVYQGGFTDGSFRVSPQIGDQLTSQHLLRPARPQLLHRRRPHPAHHPDRPAEGRRNQPGL